MLGWIHCWAGVTLRSIGALHWVQKMKTTSHAHVNRFKANTAEFDLVRTQVVSSLWNGNLEWVSVKHESTVPRRVLMTMITLQ